MVEALIEPGMRLAGRPLREVVVSIFFVEREDGPGEEIALCFCQLLKTLRRLDSDPCRLNPVYSLDEVT